MGASPLFPLIVVLTMLGCGAIVTHFAAHTPAAQHIAATSTSTEASAFLAYRAAVANYLASNPTFVGSVPFANLVARGAPTSMQGVASNTISTFGANGRIVMAYAVLSPGAVQSAFAQSDNDASLGVATAANSWTSLNPGSQPFPLPISTIPQGAIVSVIQVGQ